MTTTNAAGLPGTADKTRLIYWGIAAAAGAIAGSVTWWLLDKHDPIAKAKTLTDFGSYL